MLTSGCLYKSVQGGTYNVTIKKDVLV
jgi:hypothetical protein